MQWFHQFLSLGKVIIRSDHFSLSYIKNLKHSSNSKLLRYALLLSEYNFDIEHIKGSKNTLADGLSRRPYDTSNNDQSSEADSTPLLDLDPVLSLAAIADDIFLDNTPTTAQIDKSNARHRRRHAQTLHFLPISETSNTQPTVDENNIPTADQIRAMTSDLPPITLNEQRNDPVFTDIISYLQDDILPVDTAMARRNNSAQSRTL